MSKKKSRKKPNTPRSRIRAALRQLWLRSRERAKAIKDGDRRCADCGIKASVAKGREVKLEVHHDPQIDWDGIIDLIFERILNAPQYPLCKACHKERHMKHIDIYRKKFNIGDQDRDCILCEVCGSSPCQIHHISMKGMGGNPDKDHIENLIALCGCCHDAAHGKIKGQVLSEDYLLGIIESR